MSTLTVDEVGGYDTPDKALVGANAKCIILSIALAAGYWFLPRRNKWILLAILYFTYLAIAWYDYYYRCERDMRPTYLAYFYDFLKPPKSRQVLEWKAWPPELKRKIQRVDLIILIIIIAITPWFLRWKPT